MDDNVISSYRDLRVWREAMELAEACYRISADFPRDEIFGMTAQIRGAAVSVPANIAEGYGRESAGAYVQFLKVAQGSLKELETHLLLCQRLRFAPTADLDAVLERCSSVGRMLHALIRSVQRSI
ncbi:MAG TPA: four helix bundle protein [Vicinamibacterales bacterium]|nr:four helix bundle protein [Vicinamibacterales bacterium]